MKNIILSLFVLSCLTVNIAYAEKDQADNKVNPKTTYEQNDSEDEYEGAFKAGSPAGLQEGLTTNHNKTKETVDEANSLKEETDVFGGSTDEKEAGEEANKQEQEQALKDVDEDLMEVDKEIIEENEKESESTPYKEAKTPAKKVSLNLQSFESFTLIAAKKDKEDLDASEVTGVAGACENELNSNTQNDDLKNKLNEIKTDLYEDETFDDEEIEKSSETSN